MSDAETIVQVEELDEQQIWNRDDPNRQSIRSTATTSTFDITKVS